MVLSSTPYAGQSSPTELQASTAIAIVADLLPVIVMVIIAGPALVTIGAAIIATLYRYSVGHRLRLRGQLPGAVTASLGLAVVIGGFAVYLRFSTRCTAVYGAIAGTIIGMIGTYLAVYVVLLGAVLNAQLDRVRPAPTIVLGAPPSLNEPE